MSLKEIILASNNPHKIEELQAILAPVHCISQSCFGICEVEETGLSFVENALIKARFASRICNKPTLADDSGLVVRALHGEPGIYSARFSGKHATDKDNRDYLLKKLEHVPEDQSQAYFYCVIVLMQHAFDPTPIIVCGRWDGFITKQAAGDNGFGYDPIFYLPSYGCTSAELPAKIKNRISHRAQALEQLREITAKIVNSHLVASF